MRRIAAPVAGGGLAPARTHPPSRPNGVLRLAPSGAPRLAPNGAPRLDVDATRRESEMSDEQWWAANAPLLGRVLDATAYPTAARVGAAAGAAYQGAYSADHAFRFGLQRVLDGLGVLIDRFSR